MLKVLIFCHRIRNIIILTIKYKIMETNDLGSKKINGVQKNIDESKGKNVSHNTESDNPKLKKEVVTGKSGDKEVVERARNENEDIKEVPGQTQKTNPNANRGVTTDNEAEKTVENKDRNSDVTPNRYPNSNPESHEDRGNMKLDED
jgi:hypothetical protein